MFFSNFYWQIILSYYLIKQIDSVKINWVFCDFVKTYVFYEFPQYLKKPSIGLRPAVDKNNSNDSSRYHFFHSSTFLAYKATNVKLEIYELD
jgi:hypothetical protein